MFIFASSSRAALRPLSYSPSYSRNFGCCGTDCKNPPRQSEANGVILSDSPLRTVWTDGTDVELLSANTTPSQPTLPDTAGSQTSKESPANLEEVAQWTAQQSRDWALRTVGLDLEDADKLRLNKVTGDVLVRRMEEGLVRFDVGLPTGPATKIFMALENLKSAAARAKDPMQILWTALLKGEYDELDGGIIQLRGNARWLTDEESVLFVRDCHHGLFEIVQRLYQSQPSGKRGLVITGNPGIGKSWFLSYCILRFAQEKKTVFYESAKLQRGWLFRPDGTVTVFSLNLEPVPWTALADPSTYYLFDPCGGSPKEPFPVSAFTIVTASPNKIHYNEFLKQVGGAKYYMPCWTWAEIERVVPFLPAPLNDAVLLRERFEIFGGIFRYIASNDKMWDNLLAQAIGNSRVNDLQQTLGSPDIMPSLSHKIFHYEVTNDFQLSRAIFASDYVAERVFEHIIKFEKEQLMRFLKYAANEPALGVLRGRLFENFVHTLLPAGGHFKVRRLISDGTEETTLDLPVLREKRFSKLRDSLSDQSYARPEDKTFIAFDSFATFDGETIAFQITVADEHPLKLVGVSTALAEIKKRPMRVYFCLPPDLFPGWCKKQRIQLPGKDRSKLPDTKRQEEEKKEAEEKKLAEEAMEQYALLVPWSKE